MKKLVYEFCYRLFGYSVFQKLYQPKVKEHKDEPQTESYFTKTGSSADILCKENRGSAACSAGRDLFSSAFVRKRENRIRSAERL